MVSPYAWKAPSMLVRIGIFSHHADLAENNPSKHGFAAPPPKPFLVTKEAAMNAKRATAIVCCAKRWMWPIARGSNFDDAKDMINATNAPKDETPSLLCVWNPQQLQRITKNGGLLHGWTGKSALFHAGFCRPDCLQRNFSCVWRRTCPAPWRVFLRASCIAESRLMPEATCISRQDPGKRQIISHQIWVVPWPAS